MVPGSNATQAGELIPTARSSVNILLGPHYAVLSKRETYTTIHYPGSTVTRAFVINPRGDIVGNYVQGGVTRAFLAREVED